MGNHDRKEILEARRSGAGGADRVCGSVPPLFSPPFFFPCELFPPLTGCLRVGEEAGYNLNEERFRRRFLCSFFSFRLSLSFFQFPPLFFIYCSPVGRRIGKMKALGEPAFFLPPPPSPFFLGCFLFSPFFPLSLTWRGFPAGEGRKKPMLGGRSFSPPSPPRRSFFSFSFHPFRKPLREKRAIKFDQKTTPSSLLFFFFPFP